MALYNNNDNFNHNMCKYPPSKVSKMGCNMSVCCKLNPC